MCDECDSQQTQHGLRLFTRRAMLALGASAAGALAVAALSCREESPAPAASQAATGATSEPLGAPDLGSAVFPDAAGNPIARASDAPVIVLPRADWTKTRPNLREIRLMNGVHLITVHHTAWLTTTDAWKPTAGELESIREFHTGTAPKDRGWADIAYHFVIDRSGRVWQARPLAYQGAHVHYHNEHNLGIVLLGNFNIQIPAAAQLVSLGRFIGFLRGLYEVPVSEVFTHRELGKTSCPGKHLQSYMDRMRKKWALAEGLTWTATAPATMARLPSRKSPQTTQAMTHR